MRNIGSNRARKCTRQLAWWLLCMTLGACSPTFNWREVRPEGTSLKALFPCKPESASRTVNVGGQEARLIMLSCDVNQQTFALGALTLGSEDQVPDATEALKKASLASLKTPAGQDKLWRANARVSPAVTGWQATGVRHDGSAVEAHVLNFHKGAQVFQAAVYGPATSEVLTTWVDGLSLDGTP